MSQKGVFYTPHLTWNSVDLSSHIRSTDMRQQIEALEDTESGDTSKTEAPGLIMNEMSFTFNQDFAASGSGSIDATFGAAVAARTVAAFTYRHDSAVKSTTNPAYTGSAFIKSYTPFSGKIGDMMVATVTFGLTTAVTRDAS